jgi:hypothetical protein
MNAASNAPDRPNWNLKYNPFYLLSAMCMLAGCVAVTNSLSWSAIPLTRLLILIGTLNIYEATLIALAIFLIRRRGAERDGFTLLVLEAFFLLDITFLNAEIVTGHLGLGFAINLVLFLAACAKLGLIWRTLGKRSLDARFAFVVMQLAALFAVPIVFRWIDQGWIPARNFYFAWWAIAALVPIGDALLRRFDRAGSGPMLRFFTILPWLAIVLHLSILHYVYGVDFISADAGPLMLVLAILIGNVHPSRWIPNSNLVFFRVLLPILAVVPSSADAPDLVFRLTRTTQFSSVGVSMAGSYLTFVYLFAGKFALEFLAAGAMAILAWIFGPTTVQLENWANTAWDQTYRMMMKLIPTTALAWGATAITAAFVFLGLGATLSLRRRELPAASVVSPDSPPPIPDGEIT